MSQLQGLPRGKSIVAKRRLANQTKSLDESWAILSEAIDVIFENNVSELSFERLYTVVYGLILLKFGTQLYDRLSHKLSSHFAEISSTFTHLKNIEGLKHLCKTWETQQSYLKHISDVFIYMDTVYSKRENKPDVSSLGSRLFLKEVVEPVDKMLLNGLINEINIARQDNYNYSHFVTLKKAISVLNSLELKDGATSHFLMAFEPVLLSETEIYYRRLVDKLSVSSSESKNFNTLQGLIAVEDEINLKIFDDKDSILKFHKMTEQILVSDNIRPIAEYCLPPIVIANDSIAFNKLISLSSSAADRTVIFDELSRLIVNDISAIQTEVPGKKKSLIAITWAQELIVLKKKYDKLVSALKTESASGSKTINEAFGRAINQTNIFPEFLSSYIDSILKSRPSEFNSDIKKCVYFFKLLRDKDTFELLYRQQLSKRLLQQKSDPKLEHELISLLQEEVGSSYTSKLRGMLRDLQSSTNFVQRNKNTLPVTFDLNINILTPMFWPLQNTEMNKAITLPEQLDELKSAYERSYLKVHSGRLLEWGHHLSTVEIAFHFKKSYHILSMPMYSAIIFLLFKNHKKLSLDEIQNLCNISTQEIIKHLISMSVAPRTRILNKSPPGKTIASTDSFSINHDFNAPQQKVKVLMVLMTSRGNTNENSRANIDKRLFDSRNSVINAAIIRVLKAEKKMIHSELQRRVAELIPNFEMNSNLFKASIEYLFSNDYIQRDFDNTNMYHYLP